MSKLNSEQLGDKLFFIKDYMQANNAADAPM